MNILIVEDDLIVSMYLKQELQMVGHNVLVANNGVTGLQMCSENEFDLLLVDLLLPGNSGVELLRTVQQVWKMEVPTMVMSQMKDGKELLDLNKIKYEYYFDKPVNILLLFKRLELLMMI
jgi:DNA-binding response OmpR family regulator